jgi:hypothetical protein
MKINTISKFIATFSLFAFSAAQADLIEFNVTDYADTTAGGGVQTSYVAAVDAMLAEFQNQVNTAAGTGDLEIDEFFGGLANATIMAGSGLGSSTYNEFDYFLVGGGLGLGGVLAQDKSIAGVAKALAQGDPIQEQLAGVGGSASVTLGANAGLLFKSPWFWGMVDPTRLKGYLGFFFFPIRIPGYGSASVGALSAIGQYQLIPSQSFALGTVKWNGVNISSGLKYAKFSIEATMDQNITRDTSIDIGGTPSTTTLAMPLTANIDINTTSVTMPFEASTSVRLGYVISIVMGTSFDVNLGSASGGVDAEDTVANPAAVVTVTHDNSGGLFADNTTSADTVVDDDFANGSGNPTFLNWRAFTGLQLEFGVGGLFVTVQKAILKPQYGVNLGLNLFF